MENFSTSYSAPAPFAEGSATSSWATTPASEQKPLMTLDQAFGYCAGLATAHYENFPVASLFLPAEKRPYIQAIYAFSRIADDFADEENLLDADRLARLDDWETMLKECYEGHATHPVFLALGETVRQNRIPIEPLRDLLAAFRRDVTQNRYETFDDLLGYCRCSANPVGRLVLMIFGQREEALFTLSDTICTALQLANFWQDVFVDAGRNRCYLPLEDMRRFGYTEESWRGRVIDGRYKELMNFEIERTRKMFYDGAELPRLVEKELQVELKMVWFGGMSILDLIAKRGLDSTARPSLGTFRKIMVFLRALVIDDLSRFGRKKKPWDLT
jgi:hydroxysqualene synthase